MKNTNKLSATIRISGLARRLLIEKAATHLFARYGFRGTTTKEIAASAGVSEASLYQYFGTKAELYTTILANKADKAFADWSKEINECAARNDDENLFRAVADKISGQYQKDSDFLRLLVFSTLEGHAQAKQLFDSQTKLIYEFLRDYIKRRQREEAFQPGDAEEVARDFIDAQIHSEITKMLFRNVHATTPEKRLMTDTTRRTLDALRRQRPSNIF